MEVRRAQVKTAESQESKDFRILVREVEKLARDLPTETYSALCSRTLELRARYDLKCLELNRILMNAKHLPGGYILVKL